MILDPEQSSSFTVPRAQAHIYIQNQKTKRNLRHEKKEAMKIRSWASNITEIGFLKPPIRSLKKSFTKSIMSSISQVNNGSRVQYTQKELTHHD